MLKNRRKGFSLVEIVVVIAIMVVLLAILTPTFLGYIEQSRMQKDESAMDEVVNAAQLALVDAETFDEAFAYSIPNNYMTYTDSSGVYGQASIDEEYWAPDGSGSGLTITFNPDENGDYHLAKGIVNDMTYGNGSVAEPRTAEGDLKQCYFEEMGDKLLYSATQQVIGNSFSEKSNTYRNSSFTLFLKFDVVDGTVVVNVSGEFNGTNLAPDSPAAVGSGTSEYDENKAPITTKPGGETKLPVFDKSDLSGGGTVTVRPSYKPCPHEEWVKKDDINHTCTECGIEKEHEFPETGLTAKCTVCNYIKEHTCQYGDDNICDICGEEKVIDIIITSSNYWKAGINRGADVVVIPETFTYERTKYRVVGIGFCAFSNCHSLTSVTIPNSVKTIGESAFDTCDSLTSINIPDGVTSIGDSAFEDCSSLVSIIIPDSVTIIGKRAFWNCDKLTSINIPNRVTSIGDSAFYSCDKLTSITIPNSVTSIGDMAFIICKSLTEINVDQYNPNYCSEDGVLYNIDKSKLIQYPQKKAGTSFVIPDSVTSIGNGAFWNCDKLTSINIPDGVTSIGYHAFCWCTSLTSITIPDSVNSIGVEAFCWCTSLTSINIPDGVTSISDGAFYHCNALSSVIIPGSVKSIGYHAFAYCTSLTSINIPDGVTSIGEEAFYLCRNLTSITIPDSVTSIDSRVFYNCSLVSITYNGTKSEWNAIAKGSNWKKYVPSSCKVYFSDSTNIPIADA